MNREVRGSRRPDYLGEWATIGPYTIDLVVGDIAAVGDKCDAIAVSDDSELSHMGGVSQRVWEAAGTRLQIQSESVGGIPSPAVGDVLVSDAGRLQSRFVLHAITIDLSRGLLIAPERAPALYGAVIDRAVDLGVHGLALPMLGAGAAGLGERISLEGLASSLEQRHLDLTGMKIAVVLFQESLVESLREALNSLARRLSNQGPTADMSEAVAGGIQSLGGGADEIDKALMLLRAMGQRPSDLWPAVGLYDIVRGLADEQGTQHPLLQRATSARNDLVHGTRGYGVARARLVSGPVLQLLLNAWESGQALQSLVVHQGDGALGAGNDARASLGPSVPENDPVRALRDLLLDEIPEEQLMSIAGWLREQLGYKGRDDSVVLLEYCASDDLDSLLGRCFSGHSLGGILQRRFGISGNGQEPEALRRSLLRALGFPAADPAPGITDLRRLASQLEGSARYLPETTVRGRFVEVATGFERILRILIRFLAMAAINKAPEEWIWENPEFLPPAVKYEKAGMGMLIPLLRKLEKEIRRSQDPHCVELRTLLGLNSLKLIPPGTEDIAAIRNFPLHASEHSAGLKGEALGRVSEQLCTSVVGVIDYWMEAGGGLFPDIVTISSVEFDQWNRRRVTGRLADGSLLTIYSSKRLEPGRRYLVRSVTNPWSIDPVIVPMGDAGRLL